MSERHNSLIAWRAYWHVVTKAQAVLWFCRGKRGEARILWRWMANLPTPADIEQAKRDLDRPEVCQVLAELLDTPDALH